MPTRTCPLAARRAGASFPAPVSADQGPAGPAPRRRRVAARRGDPERDRAGARFGVSQGTVRKAIDALAADNLVVRRQGKGTFVATHTEERSSMFRFLRIRRNDGRDEYPASRLIDVRRGKASAEVARALELKPGDPVFILRRVLEYAGEPVVLDEIILPAAFFGADARASRGATAARCTACSRRSSACAWSRRRKSCARSPPTRRAQRCCTWHRDSRCSRSIA